MELTIDQALQKGIEAHKAGKFREADHFYRAIIKAWPKHPDANHNMGVLEVGVSRLEEALPFLKTALETKPSVAQYWLSYINVLIKLERMTDAKIALDEAKGRGAKGEAFDKLEKTVSMPTKLSYRLSEKDTKNSHSNILNTVKLDQAIRSAKKHLKAGSINDAERVYLDILTKFPKNQQAIDGLNALATKSNNEEPTLQDPPQNKLKSLIESYGEGQYQAVLHEINSLIQKYPRSVILYNIQGASYAGLTQLDAAIEAYQNAIRIGPSFSDLHYNMANALQAKGNMEAAIEAYNKAIKLKPDYAEAYNNKGNVLKKTGQLEEAVAEYNKAIIHNPNYADAYNNMGVALKDQGMQQKAIHAFRKTLSLQPDHAETLNNMGITMQEQGKLEDAISCYKKAIFFKIDYAEAYNNWGTAVKEQGKFREALSFYKKALSIDPSYSEAYYNTGISFKAQGKLDDAIEAYKKALLYNHDGIHSYNNLGIALKDQGKYADAIEAYKKALLLNPEYVEVYSNLGNALQDWGKLEEAISAYDNALQKKPDFHEAWNNLVIPIKCIKKQLASLETFLSGLCAEKKSHNVEIEKSLLNYRLQLGEEEVEAHFNNALSHLSHAENVIINNPDAVENSEASKYNLPHKIVAMIHFGRSGTGLLHSLIDNHPEVSTLPSIYFSEYFDHVEWTKIIAGGWSEMVDRFIATYEVLFDASTRNPIATKSGKVIYYLGQQEGMTNVGDTKDETLRADKGVFRNELSCLMASYETLDAFKFFELVHSAYNKSINDKRKKNLIFYHIHNPDTYAQLNFIRTVPDARWLVMVREPVQSCESWIRHSFNDNNYSGCATRVYTMLFEIDKITYHKQTSVGVRLEDLKERPHQTIPKLCKWLGIEESEILYKMTAQGKRWWGDPSSPDFETDGMNPFGQASIKRKTGSIFSENDQFILRTLFYPFSLRFGYAEEKLEKFKTDLKAIKPLLNEMFDFEKAIAIRTKVDYEQFKKSGHYLYLRSGLVERWETLNKHHTYPNMLTPLVLG